MTLPVPRAPLIKILLQPPEHQLAQLTISRIHPLALLNLDTYLLSTSPLLHLTQTHMHQMRRPRREVIQDMRRIHNRAWPLLRLLLQKVEEVATAQQIQVHGDLVQQQYRPRPQQPHGKLDPPPLAVGHGVHAPAQVDIKDAYELVAALRVVVAADGGQQRGHVDICAHDRVEHPFETEVGYAFEAHLEGVDACDGDGAGGGHALAGEEAEERRFSCAVGWGMLAGMLIRDMASHTSD
jgi:hypothetical protein